MPSKSARFLLRQWRESVSVKLRMLFQRVPVECVRQRSGLVIQIDSIERHDIPAADKQGTWGNDHVQHATSSVDQKPVDPTDVFTDGVSDPAARVRLAGLVKIAHVRVTEARRVALLD
jgi:hypothetical protein